jgi:hypothetical protein
MILSNESRRIRNEAVMLLLQVQYDLCICVEGLRKVTKHLSQDTWSPYRDWNPGPPEY